LDGGKTRLWDNNKYDGYVRRMKVYKRGKCSGNAVDYGNRPENLKDIKESFSYYE
jgi:hypothetical protein